MSGSDMYFLIKCGDFYVLPSKKIYNNTGQKCQAKFGGCKYEAEIIESNDNAGLLIKKCKELNAKLDHDLLSEEESVRKPDNDNTNDNDEEFIPPERKRRSNADEQIHTEFINEDLNILTLSDDENFQPANNDINDEEYCPQKPLDDDLLSEEENVCKPDNHNTKNNDEEFITPIRKRRSRSPTGFIKRVRWTREERFEMMKAFGNAKTMKDLPSLKQCNIVIKNSTYLKNRSAAQLKTWLDNQRKAEARKHM
ncbi:uncharacterized protein LOC115628451 [Scaptodrosophila lebanonensis]|uniref:Uncharacterized protein LOC115628451 n=1 Tax=Drosophila lebanonensis TaxID=7225 RepID=A0A6J2TZ28_DROLE|nr:uncharacterized protein LOC115628451 [Scaptodrosophila lebanonensis]